MNKQEELRQNILKSAETGFICSETQSDDRLVPSLIINDPLGSNGGHKVINSIVQELKECDEFKFSVAFLTDGGFAALQSSFDDCKERGVKGTIIVSQYNNFTDPVALKKLKKYDNITLKIVKSEVASMHTKGYIFRKGELFTIIVGSSNLTENALARNKEWNVKLNSLENGSYTKEVVEEFDSLLKISSDVDDEFIKEYEELRKQLKAAQNQITILVDDNVVVKPNSMQLEALKRLNESRMFGHTKGLLISATGTGKTYLSAFDAKAFNPKKLLFVVHREKIARDAMKTFKKVFGESIDAGLTAGGKRSNSRFVFAMVQTLSKPDVLKSYRPDEFDYIIFDECHRMKLSKDDEKQAMYQRVYEYFKPKFMLGMTATPERTGGEDIYHFFDHNIVYEIRLRQAMEEELICPFHYHGVADIRFDGELIDDKTEFNRLIDERRVTHVIENAEHYGFSGNRVKGLIFVSRLAEAIELSKLFNKRGYRTVALGGINNEEEREEAIARLEQDEYEGGLDYIFTVDIFNEGVDIPQVNQVIMLRPTESPVIFIQQLGRGLRKSEGKEYVEVIDFIGNYENNFMIPMALSGNRNYNKDDIRIVIAEKSKLTPGISTISFTPDVSKNIYEKLDGAKFSKVNYIVDSYKNLKNKLNRIPNLRDFAEHDAIDIIRLVQKYKSYHSFLKEKEKEYKVELNEEEEKFMDYISSKFLCGKRPHELMMLKSFLHEDKDQVIKFKKSFKERYPDLKLDQNTMTCLLNQMLLDKRWGNEFKDTHIIVKSEHKFFFDESFIEAKHNKEFVELLDEVIDYGLERYDKIYSNSYKHSNFKLYQKYTYEDVCRGLDWDTNHVSLNIGGYRYDQNTKTHPVFINYQKKEVSESVNYKDRFINSSKIIGISKGNRRIDSEEITRIRDAAKNGINILLFMRKNKDDGESKEFYFLGDIKPNGLFKLVERKEADDTVVEIGYDLETKVREDIYDYLLS